MYNNPLNYQFMGGAPMYNTGMMSGMGAINGARNMMGMGSNMMGGLANSAGRAASGITSGAAGIGRGAGLFRSLSNIKWGSLLTNTQKTLNVINQAIPVYYQVKPLYNNIKSFGKIMNIMNEPDSPNTNNNTNNTNTINNQQVPKEKENSNNQPTFFIN